MQQEASEHNMRVEAIKKIKGSKTGFALFEWCSQSCVFIEIEVLKVI